MKGFGMLGVGKAGWVEKPDPVIRESTDVLIKTTAVAHCTSDVHLVESGMLPSMIGNIIGHEAVGIIEKVGKDVKDFKVGDRVAVHDMSPHFGDLMSQLGMPNYSADSSRTQTPYLDGMFSEYIVFERADSGLAHIPENVTDIQALMVTDMVPTAFTGIDRLDIKFGETVAVLGIGPVGLCGVEGCTISGAGKIIAVGHRTACKKAAKEMGASTVIDYKEGPIAEQVLAANGGRQVDKVLVCGYYPEVFMDAFSICRAGGVVSNVAMLGMQETIPGFFASDKLFETRMIQCGRFYLERLMSLISEERIHPEKVVSHIYKGFDSIPEAFAKMADKGDDLIKTVSIF